MAVEETREQAAQAQEKRPLRWLPLALAGVLLLGCGGAGAWYGIRYAQAAAYREAAAAIEAEMQTLQVQADETERRIQALADETAKARSEEEQTRREAEAQGEALAAFLDVTGENVTPEAAADAAAALLSARNGRLEELRTYLAGDISSLFVMYGGRQYALPEMPDVPRETLKALVSAVAGELGGPIAQVAGEAVNTAIDRFDGTAASVGGALADGTLAAVQEQLVSAVEGKLNDAVDGMTGGLVSGASGVQGALDTIRGLLNTTPNYALALTVNQARASAEEVMAVLDNPAAGIEDYRGALRAHDAFQGYMAVLGEIKGTSDLAILGDGFLYDLLAEAEELEQYAALCLVLGGGSRD